MKKCLLSTLVCLMLFSVCDWPLPACAKSGSSTCQVTATAGETPPSSEPGDGDIGEPEKPDPGKEPSEKPDNPGNGDGAQPGEGDGEAEPGAPETTQEPGEAASEPDGPRPMPGQGGKPEPGEGHGRNTPETGQETTPAKSPEHPGEGGTAAGEDTAPSQQPEVEPSQTAEQAQMEPSGEPGKHGGRFWQLAAALLMLCILAVFVTAGVFRYFWTWLLFILSRKSRRRFHGILTEKKNFFIRIRDAQGSSRLAQDIIDSTGSLAEYRAEAMKEAAITEIPRQSRMRISYPGRDGMVRCREMAADEQEMFRILGKLEGAGDVEVGITCRGTGIDISLHFCL